MGGFPTPVHKATGQRWLTAKPLSMYAMKFEGLHVHDRVGVGNNRTSAMEAVCPHPHQQGLACCARLTAIYGGRIS